MLNIIEMAPFPLKGNLFAMVALLHVTAIFIIFKNVPGIHTNIMNKCQISIM